MGGGEGVGERKLSVCVASLQLLNYSSTVSRDGFGAGRTATNLLHLRFERMHVRTSSSARQRSVFTKKLTITHLWTSQLNIRTCVPWSERASVCAYKYADHTRVRDWY